MSIAGRGLTNVIAHAGASSLVLNPVLSLARSIYVGPHPDLSRSWLLRGFGRLRLRLRTALGGACHDLRLLARRPRRRGAARLPHLRAAQSREILRGVP